MRLIWKPGSCALVLVLVASIFSCNSLGHKYIIPPKKFVNVLVDIHLADGIAVENLGRNSNELLDSAALYGSVFSKYGVTRAQFDSTLNYYSTHSDDFQKLYNKVTARLKKMEDELKPAEVTNKPGNKEPGTKDRK